MAAIKSMDGNHIVIKDVFDREKILFTHQGIVFLPDCTVITNFTLIDFENTRNCTAEFKISFKISNQTHIGYLKRDRTVTKYPSEKPNRKCYQNMMYFANNGTVVIADKGINSAYKLAEGAKIENLLEHGGAKFPHIVKPIDYESFIHEFKAHDDVWKQIKQTEKETHFNKMQESSHVIVAVNKFGSRISSVKENIVNSINSKFTFIEAVMIIIAIIISIGAVITFSKFIDKKRKHISRYYFRQNRVPPSAPLESYELTGADQMLLSALKQ